MIDLVRLFFYKIPRTVLIVFILTALVWVLHTFKQLEPYVFPVVTDFEITSVERIPGGVEIRGSMTKARDCRPVEIVGYYNHNLVDIDFTESSTFVSRIQGAQKWGWWVITPPVKNLTLYARHSCTTGTVITKLYDGEI